MTSEATFRSALLRAKTTAYRDMPWRNEQHMSAYKILVSEMMLQQTQVPRVVPKFLEFVRVFPTAQALAQAKLSEVLLLWNGLGYNRRAKYLHDAVNMLLNMPEPWSVEVLEACKGIGPNTAKAVRVYAYNLPEVFIETNVRTVFVHYFLQDAVDKIHDKEILALVARCIDKKRPREWYWAVMDEGARLKAQKLSHNQKAVSFKKQTTFKGSRRQIRGDIIRLLTKGPVHAAELAHKYRNEDRYESVLADLLSEKLVVQKTDTIALHDA
jgi:A/G-specific adenine glycosylase